MYNVIFIFKCSHRQNPQNNKYLNIRPVQFDDALMKV